MKVRGKGVVVVIAVFLMLGFALMAYGQANAAEWYFTHGNSAAVEDESDSNVVSSCKRKGTGLELVLNAVGMGTRTTWVHFAVPTPYEKGVGVRHLTVRAYMHLFAGTSAIQKIRVYNGETLVKEFNMNYRTEGWNNIRLDLKAVQYFNKGLGISVQVYQDANSGTEYFAFSGAGAYFVH